MFNKNNDINKNGTLDKKQKNERFYMLYNSLDHKVTVWPCGISELTTGYKVLFFFNLLMYVWKCNEDLMNREVRALKQLDYVAIEKKCVE